MANIEKRYNRAKQIAYFLMEGGHVIKDVKEEFQISADTFQKDMKLLSSHGYGDELEQNRKLYIKAKTALYNEVSIRRKRKRE